MNNQQVLTQGAHHIGLTVPSLPATQAFFTEILGYQQVGEVPDYPAVFVTDGSTMITLWQVKDPQNAVPFDRHANVGLHHLALAVKDAGALTELHTRLLDVEGVTIEFAPESLGGSPMRHMMCSIPGGIRIEFITAA